MVAAVPTWDYTLLETRFHTSRTYTILAFPPSLSEYTTLARFAALVGAYLADGSDVAICGCSYFGRLSMAYFRFGDQHSLSLTH